MYNKIHKNIIYAVTLVSLSVIACTVQATYPSEMPVRAVKMDAPNVSLTPPVSTGIVCRSGGLNVRTAPGKGNALAHPDPLPDGTRVTIIATRYDDLGYEWLTVTFEGGAGVVRARYVCEKL